jgi:Flp pilus assembly pilin Flp
VPPGLELSSSRRREATKMRILDERGQGLTEYLILLMLISVVSIGVAKTLGNTIHQKLEEARSHINQDITVDGH